MVSLPHGGVHKISDSYVDDSAAADPIVATYLGIPGYDDRLPDLSPEGVDSRAALARAALAAMTEAEPTDTSEVNAKAVFLERVGLETELHEAGEFHRALNVIASAPQDVRQVFDLMPTATADDWAVIAKRLAAVPAALAGYQESLRFAAARGDVAALRQITKTAEQCETWAGRGDVKSFFATFAESSDGVAGGALRSEIEAGAQVAAEAYGGLADFLTGELAPKSSPEDAVGEERYRLWSREYTGATLDLHEAYEWGWEEFTRLETEMKEVAGRIVPGGSPADAAAKLDADPRYQVRGKQAFEDWMQGLSDRALSDLRGVHFDISDNIMRLECKIAPPGGGVGAYYTGPTDDWSRPGRMWWSVPVDREVFSTWREVTTVYHEGAPGHHLQIATAVSQGASLNKFQRLLTWVPAYGEGWALYAERLMDELGHFEDPGDRLGFLDMQGFRAARVIVDIGVHLGLTIPADNPFGWRPGEVWDADRVLEFMRAHSRMDDGSLRFEVNRYLGWPGQAPSYKVGERIWLDARADAQARHGSAFDLKSFHTAALDLGSLGLDPLRAALARL